MSTHRPQRPNRGLNCLFSISNLASQEQVSLPTLLEHAAAELPQTLRFPESACAAIRLGTIRCTSDPFRQTPWMLSEAITVGGKPIGIVEMGYLENQCPAEQPLFLDEERRLLALVAEILGRVAARHRTETAFQESEDRFRSLVEGSLTGISIVQDDEVVYQNPEQERLLGPLPRFNKLLDRDSIHPEDADKVEAYYRRVVSGSQLPCDIDFRFYLPGENPSGSGVKWVHCRAVTTRYRGRQALLVNMMDITPAKEMEHLLRIHDKMSSLGRVAAGIAHEIRNPLSGINIYLDTLEKRYHRHGPDEKVADILEKLRSASRKIESVIKRVMDFSKPGSPRLIPCDPNRPVREAIDLSRVSLRKSGIRLEIETAENLPQCLLDPTLIEEVVLNLIINAAEALKNSQTNKTIRIASLLAPDSVRIVVSDSGPGFAQAMQSAIFDPFYTTKNGSTGIGLSLSQRIVADHGGRLTADPAGKDGGAQFTIDLPLPGEPLSK
ncbi:ATP-binding protein [Breoghania sp.]|uniref:PAS domain-containing sensor histidine kinase n=1 Tax=Breoghania sp. TaxID=2065378 RepID=UPI0029C8B3EE|nr:ATP-binding protein [Breoghania sp.]